MAKRKVSLHMSVTAPLASDSCASCGTRLPRKRRTEMWVQEEVEDGWIAAYRLMLKGRRLLVAEVRLFPQDPRRSRQPGRWSEQPSVVPTEGVSGKALRAIRLKIPLEYFPRFLRKIERDPALAKQLRRSGFPLGSKIARRRPGRAGRPDSFYLAWAVAYVGSLAAGSRRPVKDLALRPPVKIEGYASRDDVVSEATVRDIIHQARERGLLTRSPMGLAGGELTAKADRMMKQASDRTRGRRH